MSEQAKLTDNDLLILVREWYVGLALEYDGVSLGSCISYDAIQLLRRLAGLTA